MWIENQPDNPGAVIVDGHSHTDLGVARALGAAGVPVYLVTDGPDTPVHYSRYVEKVFRLPAEAVSELEKIKWLRKIGREFRHKPVLFSTGDSSLMLLSRHRAALEHYFHHHLADVALVEQLNDKCLFAQLATEYSLPVPITVTPTTRAELVAALFRLRFPVIVKPSEKSRWAAHRELRELAGGNLKGVKLNSGADLLRFYDVASRLAGGLVVQEYIEGRDEALYSFYVYIDRRGVVKGWGLSQKIRTNPPHRGVGTVSVTRHDPGIYQLAIESLRSIGYTGLAIFQVKWSPRHRRHLVLEINARHGTSTSLYPAAGVNLPYVAYKDSLDQDVPLLPEQLEGVRWIDLTRDLAVYDSYRALREWSLLPWLRSYRGPRCYAVFSWSDPRPALVPLWQRVRRKSGKVVRRVRVAKP